jgi:hypothetical protein
MRKLAFALALLVLASFVFAQGMVDKLNKLGHDIHLYVVSASALLVILAIIVTFSKLKFKRQLAVFFMALASFLLLFPITSCFFLTSFAYSISSDCGSLPCSQELCQAHCNQLMNIHETDGIIGLEMIAFLAITVGILVFVSKGKEKVALAILALSVLLLLFIVYKASSPNFIFQCGGLLDCRNYDCCTCP